ncbi:MAG: P1 family peptidase [Syntrophomonadaceae bacterium]|jgi:L-aminopeptidase/D-esterase-like protein|nr:P1 family peptidase [Syntrophomonadaceae bacterium]
MTIAVTDIRGITVGSCENMRALTGCTVILAGNEGAVCGVDVRGAAPGTRETDLLNPVNMIEKAHAILLSGGSAYGLDAAGGVMRFLEEKGIGYKSGAVIIPIVPGAVIFDLAVGDSRIRPDSEMGYRACQKAGVKIEEGNVGAGTGATVGKIKGYDWCTKSGLGTYAMALENGLIVGAVMAVNALGDVCDRRGKIIAGVRGDDGCEEFPGTVQVWKALKGKISPAPGSNTTIGVVVCNARLNKNQATKVAQMAHNGMARVINPVHTMFDGDTIFVLATGEKEADVNVVGYMAQEAVAEAIIRSVQKAVSVQGYKAAIN